MSESHRCGSCGLWNYGPSVEGLCWQCNNAKEHADLLARCASMPADDARKILGSENFEDPGAFARMETARRASADRTYLCVECKTPMTKAERLASLACPRCVEKLGTDEETGRWDGKPEPSKDQKKGAA